MVQILALDIAGNPFRWIDIHAAINYVARGKVSWSLGDSPFVYHGGIQRGSGDRSLIEVAPVIALAKSEAMVRYMQPIPLGHGNEMLAKRDQRICAYCGVTCTNENLTRDHIIPRSRGGQDIWRNVVVACRSCNGKKGARTPEEASMSLLYIPYEPSRSEAFLLSGRGILLIRWPT